MRCLINFCAFFALFAIIIADDLNLDDILPKFIESVKEIEEDYFAQAKAAKSLNLDNVISILGKAEPALNETIDEFISTAEEYKEMLQDIQTGVGKKSGPSNLKISNKLLLQVEETISNVGELFTNLIPKLLNYANEYTSSLPTFRITSNGLLKVPKSFITDTDSILNDITAFNFEVSNKFLLWTKQVDLFQNSLKQVNSGRSIIRNVIKPIETMLTGLKNGYLSFGSDTNLLEQRLSSMKGFFKKTRRGVCIYLPIEEFAPPLLKTLETLPQTYTNIGNLAKQLVNHLGNLMNEVDSTSCSS